MSLNSLNPAEKTLMKHVQDGECCDLTDMTPPVRSEALRVMLVRSHDPAIPPSFYESNCHRWIIKGAAFEECMNLSNGRLTDGGALPALAFIGCVFHQGFCADNAHLERLEFKDCKFGTPPCDPSVCTPASQTQDASNSAAQPVAPAPGESNANGSDKKEKAPELTHTEAGAVSTEKDAATEPANEAKPKEQDSKPEPADQNQISLRNVRILGELRMERIEPIQSLEKGGLLRVDARSVRVGTSVILRELALKAPSDMELIDPLVTPYALNLRNADIRADLFLQPKVRIDGGLLLFGAHIGGDIRADGLSAKDGYTEPRRKDLSNRSEYLRYAINLDSASIDGNIIGQFWPGKDRLEVEGTLSLSSARIRGDLRLFGALVDPKDQRVVAINCSGANVQGNLSILNTPTTRQGVGMKCQIRGSLLLGGTIVNGSLSLEGVMPQLIATNLSVNGDANVALEDNYLLDLSRSTINGRLDLSKLRMTSKTSLEYPRVFLADADVKHAIVTSSNSINNVSYKNHRLARPSFYPSVSIVEIQAKIADPQTGETKEAVVSFLVEDNDNPVLLEGKSLLIHKINERLLKLDSDEKRKDYLRFFCAYVWGEYGPFRIIEKRLQVPVKIADSSDGKMPDIEEIEIVDTTGDGDTTAKAKVLYSNYLFEAHFVIKQDGKVEMSDDQTLCSFNPLDLPTFDVPLQYKESESNYATEWKGSDDEKRLDKLIPKWKQGFIGAVTSFGEAYVDLSDASCATLEDFDGQGWQDAIVNLSNFTYARIPLSVGMEPIRRRLKWLGSRPPGIPYHPQPYAHLAQVLRNEGDEESARKIEKEKMQLDLSERPIWNFVYGTGYGYGLSIWKAMRTLFVFWLLGASFFWLANSRQMMTKTEARVASVLTQSYLQPEPKSDHAATPQDSVAAAKTPVSVPPHSPRRRPKLNSYCKCIDPGLTRQTHKDPPSGLPQRLVDSVTSAKDGHQTNADALCGSDINPLLYAVESATPFLNLHQQTRCDIRTPDETASGMKAFINWSIAWQIFKLVYQIIGYLITSLAVLTFSGIARRWEQK